MIHSRMRGESVLISCFVQFILGQMARIAVRAEKRKDLLALVECLLFLYLEGDEAAASQNNVSKPAAGGQRLIASRTETGIIPVLFIWTLLEVYPTRMRDGPTSLERTPVPYLAEQLFA